MPRRYHGNRIVVPQRMIQGGFDLKFESDPYDVDLKGLLTQQEYTTAIEAVNHRLRRSRSGVVDKALLITGPLIVPLALWGIRHSNQKRRRKRLLKKAIEEFHAQHPTLLMRWNRRPESMLTIERRLSEEELAASQEQEGAMAHAQLLSDVIAPVHVQVEDPSPSTMSASGQPSQQTQHVAPPSTARTPHTTSLQPRPPPASMTGHPVV